jgi:exosome complex RNA-binding protein Csl4
MLTISEIPLRNRGLSKSKNIIFSMRYKSLENPAVFTASWVLGQVVSAARDLCKLDVIAVRKTGQERVGSVHVRDARKSELFDQTVL